jgi:hypothetical protein
MNWYVKNIEIYFPRFK